MSNTSAMQAGVLNPWQKLEQYIWGSLIHDQHLITKVLIMCSRHPSVCWAECKVYKCAICHNVPHASQCLVLCLLASLLFLLDEEKFLLVTICETIEQSKIMLGARMNFELMENSGEVDKEQGKKNWCQTQKVLAQVHLEYLCKATYNIWLMTLLT